MNFVMTALFVD